ncbi:MAG TPA: hypothetical protein VJ697_01735 [Nitrososphaeraceae archaeon]|nr:hypothetical protein [Nitrososphaeraceae archaeon]
MSIEIYTPNSGNNSNNYWNITQVAKNDYEKIDGSVVERPGSSIWL